MQQENENNVVNKTRYFKCISDKECHGRFSGLKPKQAANKAFSSILRMNGGGDSNLNKKIKFHIVECTRGSKQKTFYYEGTRTKLDNPISVNIKGGNNNKQIVYKYKNMIKKCKNEDK
jgi:hypothetical protein